MWCEDVTKAEVAQNGKGKYKFAETCYINVYIYDIYDINNSILYIRIYTYNFQIQEIVGNLPNPYWSFVQKLFKYYCTYPSPPTIVGILNDACMSYPDKYSVCIHMLRLIYKRYEHVRAANMSFQTHRSTSAVSIIGRIRARKLTLAIVGTGTTNVDTKCVYI